MTDEKMRALLSKSLTDVGMGSGWARNVCNHSYGPDGATVTNDDKWLVSGALLAMTRVRDESLWSVEREFQEYVAGLQWSASDASAHNDKKTAEHKRAAIVEVLDLWNMIKALRPNTPVNASTNVESEQPGIYAK